HVGRPAEAVQLLRISMKRFPDSVIVHRTLAWTLASHPQAEIRNGAEALDLAKRAVELSDAVDAQTLMALAAAYSETGRFAESRSTLERALQLAQAAQTPALTDAIQKLVTEVEAQKPIRSIP